MVITVKRKKLGGSVIIPPSKSVAHRALICACLRGKKTTIKCTDRSEDIDATIRCLCSLGYDIVCEGESIIVGDKRFEVVSPILDCGESGSTYRFMLPFVAALGCGATFIGAGRLGKRPMTELFDVLKDGGVTIEHPEDQTLPCKVSGKCKNGEFAIRGDVSSQYITGLLLSLPLLQGGKVTIIEKTESKPYIDITLDVMEKFGYSVIDENGKLVYNGYNEKPFDEYTVEGDWSSSAFFIVGGLIGAKKRLEILGLSERTKQGDRAIVDIATKFGGMIDHDGERLIVYPSMLHGTDVDVSDTPDLAPIIAVLAAASNGTTIISGCARLRAKESDRIESTLSLINTLGGNARADGNTIIVEGKNSLQGGTVNSFNDHRIAMSAAIASLICEDSVTIDGAESVGKSFPSFFEIFESLN